MHIHHDTVNYPEIDTINFMIKTEALQPYLEMLITTDYWPAISQPKSFCISLRQSNTARSWPLKPTEVQVHFESKLFSRPSQFLRAMQAAALKRHNKTQPEVQPQVIIVSPMTRAIETAVGAFGGERWQSGDNSPPLMIEQAAVPVRLFVSVMLGTEKLF